jgi:phosphoglycolate phosphatase-like HAD superfamily hydrolase
LGARAQYFGTRGVRAVAILRRMIGHNNGPALDEPQERGGRARLYYWRKAHKAAWRTPPIEIVKLRARAAEDLGISYRDYTSILMDRGRRPSAVFFALAGTLVRTRNGAIDADHEGVVKLMPGVKERFRRLGACNAFVLAEGGLAEEAVENCVRQVGDLCAGKITDYAVGGATQTELLESVRRLLTKHALPPSQTVLVGDAVEHERCAEAAGLARFFWSWRYFGEKPQALPH